MILGISLIIFIIFNALALLFSQKYQNSNYFVRWYYKNIFQKIFKNQSYKHIIGWTVPFLYCLLIVSFSFMYYINLMNFTITDTVDHSITLINLHLIENCLFIPAITLSNLLLVYLCYKNSFKNKKQLIQMYQYDHILYHPNTICRTCQSPKPARSKHCSICQECIPTLDHHCIWINACVSQSNLIYFDSLLLVNFVSLFYVSVRSGLLIKSLNQNFVTFLKYSSSDKTALISNFKTVRKNLLTLFLLAFCFLLVMTWFVYTQINLIMDGMSSNESDKWFAIHSLIYDHFIYKIDNKYYVITEDSKNDGTFNKFNSINFYDGKTYSFNQSMENYLVESPEQIVNIYDKGSFIDNLKERWCL